MDPLHLVIAMAKDWTDPIVVRDAPDRVPHVIEQLIEHCEALRNALVKVRAHTSYVAPTPELLAGLLASIERIADQALGVDGGPWEMPETDKPANPDSSSGDDQTP